MEQRTLQVGAMVLVLALLLRLGAGRELTGQAVGRTLLLLSSGRVVAETLPPSEAVEQQPEEPTEEPPMAVPAFGQDQEMLVQVNGDWPVDTLTLLQEPLEWDLTQAEPTVLILHTHATESYEKTDRYTETTAYRTLDTAYNIVAVGDLVEQSLTEGGITVIHDRTLYDYPSYNSAYSLAREAIEKHLKENPSICLILDLHRDAAEDTQGRQKAQTVRIDGEDTARLMLVMGSDKGNLSYPNWQRNLALALKLQAQLESDYPGLCRPVKLASSRYNQDLSTGALLIEVGSAGNTLEEAKRGAQYLAEGILALAKGANV